MFQLEFEGKRYEVDAPDAQSAVSALRKMGAQPRPEVSTTGDVLKSGASGVAQGAAGLVGMGGDIRNLAGRASEMLGGSAETGQNIARRVGMTIPGIGPMIAQGPDSQQATRGIESVTGPLHQPQTTPGRYAETVGSFLPASAIAGPGGLGMRLATGVTAGLGSEAAGQATEGVSLGGMPVEPAARVVGGVVGGIGPAAGARLITPKPVDPIRRQAINTLRSEGVQPTAGQATGSRPLRYRESEAGSLGAERAADQFTKATLRRIGVNANRATPEVLEKAGTRIGKRFDTLANDTMMRIDREMVDDVRSVANEYRQLGGQAPVITEEAADIIGRFRNGQRAQSGGIYKAWRSRLNKRMRATTDPELKMALGGLQDALDGAMERTAAAAGRNDWVRDWRAARRDYRNLLVVEAAALGGGEQAALGIITPAKLRQATVQIHGRRNYARGKGDFARLARSGNAVLSSMPDSGTASRMSARGLPGVAGAGAGGSLGYMISGGDPVMTSLGTMAGVMGPPMINRAIISGPGQRYLSNQLMPPNAGNIGAGGLRALELQGITAPRQIEGR